LCLLIHLFLFSLVGLYDPSVEHIRDKWSEQFFKKLSLTTGF
jgi:hypothetical protein